MILPALHPVEVNVEIVAMLSWSVVPWAATLIVWALLKDGSIVTPVLATQAVAAFHTTFPVVPALRKRNSKLLLAPLDQSLGKTKRVCAVCPVAVNSSTPVKMFEPVTQVAVGALEAGTLKEVTAVPL
jgi:hypothetical protein